MARRLLPLFAFGLLGLGTLAPASQVPVPDSNLPPVEPIPSPVDDLPPVPLPPAKERPQTPVPVPVEGAPDDPLPTPEPARLDPQVERVAAQAGTPPSSAPSFTDRLGEGPQELGLMVDVSGPPSANLNIDTSLTITVRNQGRNDAHEVVVTDSLPPNLQFVESNPRPDQQAGSVLSWKLGTLAASTERIIDLKVKPVAPGPIDHVPRVDFSTGAKARMTILKPELKIEITASETEALKGKDVDFNVTIINTGDGLARNVVIQAAISKGLEHEGEATVFSQDLGDIEPKKSIGPIPFTVVGKALGEQTCEVSALSPDVVPAGQPGSVAKASVNIIAPELVVNVIGPKEWSKGTIAQYIIKVTNNGTAPAEDVKVAAFPPFTGSPIRPSDAEVDRDEQKGFYRMYWSLQRLDPGQSKEFRLSIRLDKIQNYILNVAANAAGVRQGERLETVRGQITTQVAGIPDVQIVEVKRSTQVISLGEQAEFEIRLRNVGSQDAEQVQVGFQFSDKLKVEETEGTDKQAAADPKQPNWVVFPPIDRIEAGGERQLFVRVSGLQGGIADFQVEAFWKGLDPSLAVHHKTFIRVATGDGNTVNR